MGIEQSTYSSSQSSDQRQSGPSHHGKAKRDLTQSVDESGRSSPHPSICSSDADVPYVSYTVNRPIGGMTLSFIKYLNSSLNLK